MPTFNSADNASNNVVLSVKLVIAGCGLTTGIMSLYLTTTSHTPAELCDDKDNNHAD